MPTTYTDVTEHTFPQQVLARSHEVPVVVDFWAPWCGPCRALGPVLERLAGAAEGQWVLAKINTDENQRLAQQYNIQGIPAVKAFYGGKVVDEFTGALPEGQVRAWLKGVVPSEADALVAAAEQQAETDPDSAIERYRLALGADPANANALFGLGRLLTLRGAAEGTALLHEVPAGPLFNRAQALLELGPLLTAPAPGPAVLDAHWEQAVQALQSGQYASALDHLIEVVQLSRGYRDDGALGDEHPLTANYRRALSSALF
jgi:putative thioredoxin